MSVWKNSGALVRCRLKTACFEKWEGAEAFTQGGESKPLNRGLQPLCETTKSPSEKRGLVGWQENKVA